MNEKVWVHHLVYILVIVTILLTGYLIFGEHTDIISDLEITVGELRSANTKLSEQNSRLIESNIDIRARLDDHIRTVGRAKSIIGDIEEGLTESGDTIQSALRTIQHIEQLILIFAEEQ
jgi:hypothetical protein